MKRFGFILISSVILLMIFTISLAQMEARNAKYLLRVLTGRDVRGYYGSTVIEPRSWNGQTPMFAISQSGESDGPTRVGQIFFYDSLLAEEAQLVITSPNEGELFGWAMSGGGDWNGDGTPDLAVGAPNAPTPTAGVGKVYLYFGGADFGRSLSGSLSSGEEGDGFGEAVHLESDINGDALSDLIVGAPRSAKTGATAGRVYIWFGKQNGTPAGNPDVEIPLGTINDLFGTAIATGDLNGDGQADLAIGAPHHNIGDKIPGSVFVFFGGTGAKFTRASQVISGEATQFHDQFGKTLAIVTDQNGDGKAELIIGAPQVTVAGRQLGKVYLYHGGTTISKSPAATFLGATEAGRFGENVFSLGDMNSDGKGDFAVQARDDAGSRGVVYFYLGGGDREYYRFSGETVADQLGNSVAALAGVFGGTGKALAVAARWNDSEVENAGRVYLLSIE